MSWETEVKNGIRSVIADSHVSYFLRHAVANDDDVESAVTAFYHYLILPLISSGKLLPVDVDSDIPLGSVFMMNPDQIYHGPAEGSPLLEQFPFMRDWKFPEQDGDKFDVVIKNESEWP